MNKGKIENQGTHNELLQKSPVYKELWDAHIGVTKEVEVR